MASEQDCVQPQGELGYLYLWHGPRWDERVDVQGDHPGEQPMRKGKSEESHT